jgi:dolichol-phosphate mannosyltransferase
MPAEPAPAALKRGAAIGIACAVLDILTFEVLLRCGVGFGAAHLGSFGIAGLLGFVFLRGPAMQRAFIAVAALSAMLLRGGVLATAVRAFHIPAPVSIVAATGISAAIIWAAFLIQRTPAGIARWRALAWGLAGFFGLLRLVYLGNIELLPEEAYYWNYKEHLDIGYLDHPPMVAWLIGVTAHVIGDTEFGVRFGAWLCWIPTAFFVFRLTWNLFDQAAAWVSLALVAALPFFFGVTLTITPDSSMTAAWAASLFFLERALIGRRYGAWLGLGVAMGIGMLSKYSIALVGLAGLLFMVLDPVSRRWFLRWEPYAAVLVAAAFFSPVLIWNAQHDWASFTYQGARRIQADPRFSLHELLGSMLALLTPTGVAGLALAAFSRGPMAEPHRRRLVFAQICTGIPLAVFFFFSLRHMVKLSWTGPVWLAAIPLLALGVSRPMRSRAGEWIRSAWGPTFAICALLYGLVLHYLALGLPGVPYSAQTNLLPVGWRELAAQVDRIESEVLRQTKAEPLVLGTDRNFISSELAFYDIDKSEGAKETAGVHLFGKNALMYELWFPEALQEGKSLILVAFDAKDLTRAAVDRRTAHLGPVVRGELSRDGKFIRPYFYRVAYGYSAEEEEEKRR